MKKILLIIALFTSFILSSQETLTVVEFITDGTIVANLDNGQIIKSDTTYQSNKLYLFAYDQFIVFTIDGKKFKINKINDCGTSVCFDYITESGHLYRVSTNMFIIEVYLLNIGGYFSKLKKFKIKQTNRLEGKPALLLLEKYNSLEQYTEPKRYYN